MIERKSTMYKKVNTELNFVEREKATEKFWRDNDIFKKSMENRKEGETYTFYDGPANSQRQAAYRSCRDTYHQRYDPSLSDHEGQVCSS